MSKKPKHAFIPSPKKQPKTSPAAAPESFLHEKPRWRISFIDYNGPWGFDNINDPSSLREILDKMKNLESMRWSELLHNDHHEISVGQISKAARDRLREIGKDDYDTLFSIRLKTLSQFPLKSEGLNCHYLKQPSPFCQ